MSFKKREAIEAISDLVHRDSSKKIKKFKIYTILPKGNIGDRHHSEGIVQAVLYKLINDYQFDYKDIQCISYEASCCRELANKKKLVTELCRWQQENVTDKGGITLILAVGPNDYFAEILGQVIDKPNALSVYSTHQLSSRITSLVKLPHIIAVPRCSISEQQIEALKDKTTLILVNDIAHPLDNRALYEGRKSYLVAGYRPIGKIDKNTIGIILGGDAPDIDGRILRFTPEQAQFLAKNILQFEREQRPCGEKLRFIVINGPRTGKYNIDGQPYNPSPHNSGKLDRVTEAFIQTLINHHMDVDCYNFQFSQQPSAYIPLLTSFKETNNRGNLHVPGDSLSMISETTTHLSNVIIDELPSMNECHYRFCQDFFRTGKASFLNWRGEINYSHPDTVKQPAASQVVAEAILLKIFGS